LLGWNQYGLQDGAGEWWIPTDQGLCRFPKVSRAEQLAHRRPNAVYTTEHGLTGDAVWRIYEDSGGDIWIVSRSRTAFGLARWERATETLHRYTKADGVPPGASAFCEDASGNLWIGGGGTLTRYAAGRFRVFTTADGVPASGIRALYLDPDGRLWIATDSRGLSRIDDPKADRPRFVTYTTANGLSSNQVWSVTSDQWGRIYAFTGRGLDRLDAATGRIKHYTTTDGLVGDIPTTAFRDRHGALWFGTYAGFSKLIPELDSHEAPPPILISGLRIVGERHPLSELGETEVPEIRLGPNDDQVQIDFVGLSFETGEQLRYQYKLEGADADWSAPSDQRSVNYAQLSPGRYRFLVRAVTSEGTTSQSPASVSLTILPPIWQRWWFLASTAIAIYLVAYSMYRYRVVRLVELERVRTRIATDLHDDIGASLSRIAILSEVCKRQVDGAGQESVPLLSEIAESARAVVDSVRDTVWAINPRHDDLLGVVSRVRQFASGLLEPRRIRWDLRTAPGLEKIRLDPDERRHLHLFFKEAVTNAVRHAECRSLSISLTAERHRLVAEVRDDGRGLEQPVPDVAESGGHGFKNMEARAAHLRGRLSIESGPGQGTCLRLLIPLRR
jgi:streptogramin lyase/signal transduction histidine kinase